MTKTTKIIKGFYKASKELMTENGLKTIEFEMTDISEGLGYTAWSFGVMEDRGYGFESVIIDAFNTKKEILEHIDSLTDWKVDDD